MRRHLSIEARVPKDRNYLGEISGSTTPTGYVSAKSAPGFEKLRPGTYRMKALAEFEGRVNDPRAIQLYGPGIIFFEAAERVRGRDPGVVPVHGGQLDAFGRMIQTDGGLRVTDDYMRDLLAAARASDAVTLNIIEENLGFFRRWFRPKVSASVPQYPVRDQHSDIEHSYGSEGPGRSDDRTDDRPFWYWFMSSDRGDTAARSARGPSDEDKPTDWRTTQDPVLAAGRGSHEGWRLVPDDVMRAKPDAKDPVIIDPFPAADSSPSHEPNDTRAADHSETVDMAAASPAVESPSSSGTSY